MVEMEYAKDIRIQGIILISYTTVFYKYSFNYN